MIAYPYATDETGEIVHISDAEKIYSYHCTGCDKPMVCRQGEKREWHFAHKATQDVCSWESVLHKQAKYLIAQGFRFAQKNKQPYFIHLSCDTCENNYISGDIASSCSDVILEESVVDNTRSDIVFIRNSNGYLIIEVVVEHALEPETEARYKAAGHPVFILELDDFCQLKDLEKQIVIHRALNTKTTICKKCKEREEEWEKQRHLIESELHRLSTRIPAESKRFRHWDKDKYGNSMFPSTKEKVFANAKVLCELGFRQHNSQKPWSFSFYTRWGTIYAHLGGTDVIPIWKDTAPMLHGIGADGQSSELQRLIFDIAYKKIEAAGIELRTSFYFGMI